MASTIGFYLRLDPALHARLAVIAQRERRSLNSLIVLLLDRASSPTEADRLLHGE